MAKPIEKRMSAPEAVRQFVNDGDHLIIGNYTVCTCSGPSKLITQKGIFEFHPVTKEIYLAEIHPRMTVRNIQKDIPWDLKISENLLETKKPSDEEIDFIRKFAPAAAMGRALSTEVAFANLTKELEARGKMSG
jgi:hypothetical protein